MRKNLPYHDLLLYPGLVTNYAPESVAGQALRNAKNIDGFVLFRGVSKLPGSSRVSDDHGDSVLSLHQFEYTRADTQARQREQLSFAADGVLRKINADKSLTSLKTGVVAEALFSTIMSDKIFLSSANQKTLPTGSIKYDGNEVSNWGVLRPGIQEEQKEDFDTSGEWSAGTDTAVSNSSENQDGDDSLVIDKTGTAGLTSTATKTYSPTLDLTTKGDVLAIWVYIASDVIDKLATSGTCLELRYGNSGLGNSDAQRWEVGELAVGWNLLTKSLASPDATIGAGATLSAIVDFQIQTTFKSTASTGALSFDHLHLRDDGAPTAVVAGGGVITATVRYVVTFVTKYGLESNAGPPSTSLVLAAQSALLSNVPVSDDPQVVKRRLYRDKDGDGIYLFVKEMPNNITTGTTDNTAEANLGTAQPPLAGDASLDNGHPGRLRDAVDHNGRIYAIDAASPQNLKISRPNQPEAFPDLNTFSFEEDLVAVETHALGVMVYSTDKLFLMTGNGGTVPFKPELVNTQVGTNGFRSVARVKGVNVTLRESELFVLSNPSDEWFINGPVLDQFQAVQKSPGELTTATVLHDRSRFRVIVFPEEPEKIFVYQYGALGFQQITGEGPGTDPQDLRTGAWYTIQLPEALVHGSPGVVMKSAAMMERTADLPELWVGCTDGYVYYVQDPATTDYAKQELTPVYVEADFETVAVPLGGGPGGRGEPRFLQLNAEAFGSATWAVTVTLLTDSDGKIVKQKTFNVTIGPGKTSQVIAIPSIGARGEWCRVKMVNANTGEGGTIKNLRLYYIPRSGFRGERAS